jgi:hypothetical protein
MPVPRFRQVAYLLLLPGLLFSVQAREIAGIMLDERIQISNGSELLLNGAGLREKLWVDVYVGSLYLPQTSRDIAEIYSNQGPYRIQLDFVYKKVSRDNLIEAWDEGFRKNQTPETLSALEDDLQRLYAMFDRDAVRGDQFIFDYLPSEGVTIQINGETAGRIEGERFKDALLDIWLGNVPADKDLKRGMIGLE